MTIDDEVTFCKLLIHILQRILGHDHRHDVNNIKAAFFLNVTFTIIELIGGWYVNSVAIMSDAIHDLGDSLALGSAWYFQNLSHKDRDHTYTYGYRRYSLLSALLNSTVLFVGSIYIIYSTIPRLIAPESTNTKGMILLSVLGIIFNGLAVLKTNRGQTTNERVVSLHLMEDVLGWIAILLGSIVMSIWYIPIIDPILSIMIAAYILYNVFKNLKESIGIILQTAPSGIDVQQIQQELHQIQHVQMVHDVHVWSMDGSFNIMTVHLVLKSESSFTHHKLIKQEVRKLLNTLNIGHVTIELESADDISQDPH